MCGIAGIISADPKRITRQRLKEMTDTIIHRGPESEAFWIHDNTGFGHRRLCIIDLSDGGAQPMHFLERYTIVYNGELYNYKELKTGLQQKGFHFKSASDTEVLLAAYACYKEKCVEHFDGMFAFAIWDAQEKKLFAARDRFGEKPFYYALEKGTNELLFASEIKAIQAAGGSDRYDDSMLLNYLGLGYTTHPRNKQRTFYKDIQSLPAAHYLTVRPGEIPKLHPYWKLNTGQQEMQVDTAVNRFIGLLNESVKRRLRSDVPVGTSLSGGLDSSTVVATAKQFGQNTYSHKSFSAIFPGYVKDEADHVRIVANALDIESFFTTPDGLSLSHDFDRFIQFHEQPVSTASAYAQYKVYELAKQHNVTVLLDGQGADETLAGYYKYIHWYLQELTRKNRIEFRKAFRSLKANNVPFAWGMKNTLSAWLPAITATLLSNKAAKTLQAQPDLNIEYIAAHIDQSSFYKPRVGSLNELLHFNVTSFGLPELLRYADSNSMAHSREVRLPFLNHELVEFIFSLSSSLKINDGWTKWILRRAMQDKLPPSIVWRKEKIGFEPPQEIWMRHPLIQERLRTSKEKLVALKILKQEVINKKNQSPQNVATDNDWRYLVAGSLIK